MEITVQQILKQNKLSVTESRQKILGLFLTNRAAIAHADIEHKAGEKFDRVTVYRTLQTFVEKGIIHTIPSSDNTIKYALCRHECFEGHHHDNHFHFVCSGCGKTECLEDFILPSLKLPKGYLAKNIEIVINGTCTNCK